MFRQSRAKCCIRLCKLLPCMHTYLTMPQHHLLNHLEVCSCAYNIGFNGGHHPSCSYISQWREQQRMSAQISWNLQSLDLGPEWLRRTEPLTYVTLQRQGTLEPTEIRTPWRTVVARQYVPWQLRGLFFPANSSKNLSRSACRAAPGRMSFIL